MSARERQRKTPRTAKQASPQPSAAWWTQTFTRFSNAVARATGRPITFASCCAAVVLWALLGPAFGFSDSWQLVINTGTTIVTFLMVFLIQNTQNRDGAAIQAKLDELIRALHGARNQFVGIEHLTDDELEAIRKACEDEIETIEKDETARGRRHQRIDAAFDRLLRAHRTG